MPTLNINNDVVIFPNANVGVGTTPSPWTSAHSVIQFAAVGSLESDDDAVALSNNRYFDGQNKYRVNDFASIYVQVNGSHLWYNAPSGTADNPITFTQAMTLANNGNLLIGTTTDSGYKFRVNGTSYFDGLAWFGQSAGTGSAFRWGALGTAVSSDTMLSMNQIWNGSGWAILNSNVGTTYLNLGGAVASPSIDFGTGAQNTEATTKMRITNGGNVLIGTTTDAGYKLAVNGKAVFGTSQSLEIGNAAANPVDSGISYGIFHQSGVGLGIVSGAGGTTQGIDFWSNDGTNYFQSMRISGGNGNVGVGTITPAVRFQVAGQTSFYNGVTSTGAIDGGVFEQRTVGFNLGPSESIDISTIGLTSNTTWKAILSAEYANNLEGGGLTSSPLEIELDSDNPTILVGSTNITLSRNSSTGKLQATNANGTYRVTFVGSIKIWNYPQSAKPTISKVMLKNVGIGITNPTVKLDVDGPGRFVSDAASRVLYLKQNANNTGNIIQFQNESGTNTWELVGRNNQFYFYNAALANFPIYIHPATSNVSMSSAVDTGDKLFVNGTGRFDGQLKTIQGGRTLFLGDGAFANHINVDSNVDFAFNYNNGNIGGFGFFAGGTVAKFFISNSGDVTARKMWLSTNGATDATTAILANASTNDSTSYAAIFGSLNAGYRMVVRADGNVGIGTTSPTTKLHVNGGSIFNQDGFLYMSNQFPIVWGAAVSIEGDNVAGTLTLKTESSHRIFINNVGNVGVGTTSPTNRLTVTTATNAVDVLRLNNTGGDSGSVQGVTHLAINHFNAGTNPSTRITAYQDSTSGWPGGMYFSTRSLNTDSAPVERMRITSGGNVGIATATPNYTLHVAGDVQIDAEGNAPSASYVPDGGFGLDSLVTSSTENIALGKPDVWLRIHVDGVAFVFPGYQEP